MKKVIFLLFFILGVSSFGYINIYPTEIVDSVGKNGIKREIELYNGTNEIRKYRVYFEDGTKVANWGDVSPKGITLLPGEKKIVKVWINAPFGTKKGRYSGILSFKEIDLPKNKKEKDEQMVKVFTEYRMPIIAYVGEKGRLILPANDFGENQITFLDLKGNKMVYSIDGNTYVKDLDREQIVNILGFKIVKRMLNYYLIYEDEENKKYGLVGLDLMTPYARNVQEIEQSSKDPNIFAIKQNGSYGLYKFGYPITKLDYEYIGGFKGKYVKFKKDGKYGIMDIDGKVILPAKAEELYIATNGNWIGKINGKYQTDRFKLQIDEIIPTKGSYLIYKKNNKYGVLNIDKMKLTEVDIDDINENIDHGVVVSNGKKYAIVSISDLELKKPIKFEYDLVGQPGGDTYSIVDYKSGKYGYYNVYSGIKTDAIYESITPRGNLFFAKKQGVSDVYNRFGTLMTQVDDSKVIFVGEDIIVEKNEDNYIIIDLRGEK